MNKYCEGRMGDRADSRRYFIWADVHSKGFLECLGPISEVHAGEAKDQQVRKFIEEKGIKFSKYPAYVLTTTSIDDLGKGAIRHSDFWAVPATIANIYKIDEVKTPSHSIVTVG